MFNKEGGRCNSINHFLRLFSWEDFFASGGIIRQHLVNSEEKAKLVSLYVGSVFFHVENIFIVFFEIKGTFKAFVQWGKKSFKVTHIKKSDHRWWRQMKPTSLEDLTCSNMPWLDLAWHDLTFAILAILTHLSESWTFSSILQCSLSIWLTHHLLVIPHSQKVTSMFWQTASSWTRLVNMVRETLAAIMCWQHWCMICMISSTKDCMIKEFFTLTWTSLCEMYWAKQWLFFNASTICFPILGLLDFFTRMEAINHPMNHLFVHQSMAPTVERG